jgi:hypothetical protein
LSNNCCKKSLIRLFTRPKTQEGGGGGGWFLGGGCRGGIGCGSSSSYSSSLSEVSDSSSWVGLACLACHGGSGPHSSGRSGSGV